MSKKWRNFSMILYHGTNVDFDEIEIKKTRNYKDFGQGFYLTDIKSQAEELATKRALMFGGTPIVQNTSSTNSS